MKSSLIVFYKNPLPATVKTRVGYSLGDDFALALHLFLAEKTCNELTDLNAKISVYYSQSIVADDLWDKIASGKKTQKGKTLGERMSAAFEEEFSNPDFDSVGIIGSDIYPLNATYIRDGFNALAENDVVVGPAVDGGYYFLGMKRLHRSLFEGIDWGTSDVFEQTRSQIVNEGLNLHVLPELRDIDTVHDVHDSGLFKLINSKIS